MAVPPPPKLNENLAAFSGCMQMRQIPAVILFKVMLWNDLPLHAYMYCKAAEDSFSGRLLLLKIKLGHMCGAKPLVLTVRPVGSKPGIPGD